MSELETYNLEMVFFFFNFNYEIPLNMEWLLY